MKVVAVNSIRVSGGGEKWLVRQAGCWRARGHDPVIVCQPGSGLAGMAFEAGLRVELVPMPHDISPRGAAGIHGVLRRQRPGVVICCNERAFRLAVPAARLAHRPPVVYRNGLTATFKNRTINRWLFRWADRMIVISEALRAEMASYGWIPPDRLRIIRNGIELAPYGDDPQARARVRLEFGVPENTVVAAVLARVTPDKGQAETIDALAALTPSHPDAELWIVGEGTLRPRLEALAAERGVASRVRFLGFRRDIPAVLQAVDIVVQASHREGLGNTLLEAMASARPIVASAVGGILDVVVPGETGELVPPYSATQLATALAPLLTSAELRARYGENGRRRVEEVFPLEGETDQWCKLFCELDAGASVRKRSGTAAGREVRAGSDGVRG